MRPAKRILCVDDNDQDLSTLCYMLEVNGYRTARASTGQQAINIFCEGPVDLVLASLSGPDEDVVELIKRLKPIAPYIPMAILGPPWGVASESFIADAVMEKRKLSSAELLEQIRILIRRKRGPRKQPEVWMPNAEPAAPPAHGADA